MGFLPFAGLPGLSVLAATPAAGVALVNGTPTLLSYTFPNDGNQHLLALFGELVVTSAQTGGAVLLNFNDPGGTLRQRSQWAGGLPAAFNAVPITFYAVAPNQTVTLTQSTAQTAGAATFYGALIGG